MRDLFYRRAVLCLVLAIAAGPIVFAAGQEEPLPEGQGKRIVEASCISCHGLGEVTNNRLSKKDWQEMVDAMVSYGAEIERSQVSVLVDYLTKHFGSEAP